MALFKIFNNFSSKNQSLPSTYNEGYCYFDVNTKKFWIDTTDTAAGRVALNAVRADIADVGVRIPFGTCTVLAGATDKAVSLGEPAPWTELKSGVMLAVYFEYGNTIDGPSLSISGVTNSDGDIYLNSGHLAEGIPPYSWSAGTVVVFTYMAATANTSAKWVMANYFEPTVKQIIGTDSNWHKVLLHYNGDNASNAEGGTSTNYVWGAQTVSIQPSSGTLVSQKMNIGGTGVPNETLYINGNTEANGFISVRENGLALEFNPGDPLKYIHTSAQMGGDGALVFGTNNASTSFIFANGESRVSIGENRWKTLTPGVQIKNNSLYIKRLLEDEEVPTYAFYVNGTSYHNGLDTHAGDILPEVTGTRSLGNTGLKWRALFLGSADSYGDAYTPIYWNNGVPAQVGLVQYKTWTIASGGTSVVLSNSAYTADSYVLTLVITSGESYLNGPVSWTTAAGTLTISTSTATSGAISGYVITARGVEI